MSFSFQRDGTLKHLFVLLFVASLWACGGKKPEQSQTAVKEATISVATHIAKQNLRQTLAGTAYGNCRKMKQALAADNLAEIVGLALESLSLLQAFVEEAEQDSLMALVAAAKNASADIMQVLNVLGESDREPLREAIALSELHLASLRELAGMNRMWADSNPIGSTGRKTMIP